MWLAMMAVAARRVAPAIASPRRSIFHSDANRFSTFSSAAYSLRTCASSARNTAFCAASSAFCRVKMASTRLLLAAACAYGFHVVLRVFLRADLRGGAEVNGLGLGMGGL